MMGKKLKIALVVGHRKSNQGAYGSVGVSEYEFGRHFVHELFNLVKHIRGGVEFKMFYRRDAKGYRANMRELHERIDAWGADLDIEFHFNASSNKAASGHEVLYASKKGKKYAKMLNDRYAEYLPYLKDRGIKKRRKGRGSYGLKIGKSASLIVEPFFASHQHMFIKNIKKREDLLNSYIDMFSDLLYKHADKKLKKVS